MPAEARIVLLHGEEQFLVDQEARQLMAEWQSQLVSDFGFEALDPSRATAAQLRDAVLQAPFLDPFRAIVLRGLGAARAEAVAPVLAEVPESSRLLITVNGRLSPGNRLLKQAQAESARIKDFPQLKGRKLDEWASARARELRLPANVAALTVRVTPPELAIIDSELRKLAAYRESGHTLDNAAVRHLLAGGRADEFFKLTDRILPRVRGDAWSITRNLIDNGTNPTTIAYRLARHLALVLDVRTRQEQGQSLPEIQAGLREHPFVVQKAFEVARSTTPEHLRQSLKRLLDYEWEVKSGQVDAEFGLEVALATL